MAINNTELRKRERVEIERSDGEAAHQDLSRLKVCETQIARYMNPPAETAFPLEYSYHLLGDVRGQKVLDFGSGNGENTILLAKRGADVYSMDISTASVKVAEKRLEANDAKGATRFFVGSAHDIPLASESVDVVFGMAILHHLNLELAAREVFRVLKKGGRAIFQEPVRNSKLMWFMRNLIPYKQPDLSPFERPLRDDELHSFAKDFASYKSRAFSLPYVNLAYILARTGEPLYKLQNFDDALLRKVPALQYYATIRVIEMVK